ncbi:MAG: isopenicillin synthase [Rhodospirillales bacterium]|nr:isopenicillin synthase [Rhodospirillales bacterium]
MMFDTIPLVDLADAFDGDPARRLRVAREVGKACATAGFFLIGNHGVPAALVADQYDWAQRFFDLPAAEKRAISLVGSTAGRGYEAIGEQQLDENSAPDLKESFYCGIEHPADHPYALAGLNAYGPNRYPAGLPGFAAQMDRYIAAQTALGTTLMRLLALSLDLDERYFDPMLDNPMITLRLLRYPPHPANARPDQFGAGAHTDWGAITVLAQDDLGGLEVMNPAGRWIPATPMPGTFVVNLGDMIPRWTNGRYRSNPHRVVNRDAGRERYSVPFFFGPSYHSRVECLPTCRVAGAEPLYPPCSAGEHLAEMYRKTYGIAA